MDKTTSGLRGVLFEEIAELRTGGDPRRAMAIAKLAQQIIATAKVEMDFHRLQLRAQESGKELEIGAMDLGERVKPVGSVKSEAPSIEGDTGGQQSQSTTRN